MWYYGSTGQLQVVKTMGASRETASASSRTGLLPIQPMQPLRGSIKVLIKDWSVDAKIQKVPLIHPTWTHQTSFYGVIWKTLYRGRTLRQSLNWNKQPLRTSVSSPTKNASEWLTTLHAISKSVSSRNVYVWSKFCNVL